MKNKMKTIDIIIPAFNAEKTISRTLDSLYNQSYTAFKVIVVNDASIDNTVQIVKSYFDKLDICLINLKQNKGVSNARNVGIENSNGDYILFIDSDDAVDENYIEHFIEIDPKKDFVVIDHRSNNEIKDPKGKVEETTVVEFKKKCWDYWSKYRITNVWGVRYSRKIIELKMIRFDTDLKWGEDTKFNIQYLKECSTMVTLPYAEYIYFDTANSVSHKYEKSRFENALNVAKTFAEFADDSEQLWMVKYIYWDMSVRHCINHLEDNPEKQWKKEVMVDMKKAIKEPFFRECIQYVLRRGSLDMKIYAFFLKINCICPYIYIAKHMHW